MMRRTRISEVLLTLLLSQWCCVGQLSAQSKPQQSKEAKSGDREQPDWEGRITTSELANLPPAPQVPAGMRPVHIPWRSSILGSPEKWRGKHVDVVSKANGTETVIARNVEVWSVRKRTMPPPAGSDPEIDYGVLLATNDDQAKALIPAIHQWGQSLSFREAEIDPTQPHGQSKTDLPPLGEMLEIALRKNPDLTVTESKVREAEAELNRTRLSIIRQVISLHNDWRSRQNAIELHQREVFLIKEQIQRTEQLYQKGETALAEVSKVQLSLTSAEYALMQSQVELAELEAAYGYLLGESLRATKARVNAPVSRPAKSENLESMARSSPRWRAIKEEMIRMQLDQPTELDFPDIPLPDALDFISDLHRIQILIDEQSFKDTVGPLPTIKAELSGVPLGVGLQAIEDTNHIRFVVRDYGLLAVPENRVPKDAVLLREFWKGEPAKPASRIEGTRP